MGYQDFQKFISGSNDCVKVQRTISNEEESETIEQLRKLKKPDGSALGVPISTVLCVPSMGGKNRIVTKSHPGLVLRAQDIRKKCFNLLLSDSRLRSVLKGDRAKAVEEISLGDTDNIFVSADLTAASDRIPFSLAMALWQGAIDAGLLNDEE